MCEGIYAVRQHSYLAVQNAPGLFRQFFIARKQNRVDWQLTAASLGKLFEMHNRIVLHIPQAVGRGVLWRFRTRTRNRDNQPSARIYIRSKSCETRPEKADGRVYCR